MESTNSITDLRQNSTNCDEFKTFRNNNNINLSFTNITYTVRKHVFTSERKKVLHNVSGDFKSGELTAIMGPSGAGKTSLLNIISGYITKNVTGELKVNGKNAKLNLLRRFSSYIMQDDHVHSQLTVLESMKMAAELKLEASSKDKMQRVDFIIKLMDLETVANTFTQNLSGGQRKRLVIAFELLNDSPVMFFDEPTSHQDSVTSRQCVEIMKSLALGGRTIICTIHQPSATLLNMFDHLYVVAKGQCVYDDSIPNLIPFLDELGFRCPTYHNPSDFMLDVVSDEFGDHTTKLAEAAKHRIENLCSSEPSLPRKKSNSNSTKNKKTKIYTCSMWKQFTILLRSNLIRIWRNRDTPMSIVAAHFFMAIFIGYLYWQVGQDAKRMEENAKMIFFNIMFLSFCALSSTVQSFPEELQILTREYFNSWYSVFPLYMAKKFTYVTVTTSCTIGYTLITYFMTDQPIEINRMTLIVFQYFLIGVISLDLGIFFAAALNPKISLFLGMYSLMPHLVFSGLYVRSRDMIPLFSKMFDFSIYKHCFEGIMLATYGYGRSRLDCPDLCVFTSPKGILNEYDMQNADYWYSTKYLVSFYLVIDVATYVVVRWRLSR